MQNNLDLNTLSDEKRFESFINNKQYQLYTEFFRRYRTIYERKQAIIDKNN